MVQGLVFILALVYVPAPYSGGVLRTLVDVQLRFPEAPAVVIGDFN